jgi:hypothetical protein
MEPSKERAKQEVKTKRMKKQGEKKRIPSCNDKKESSKKKKR